MEYQAKLNEKYMSVLSSIVAILYFKFFEDISYEKLQNTPVLLFVVVLYQLLHQQILFFTIF